MATSWFKEFGWIYYPTSVAGTMINLFVLVFCVVVYTAVDRNSHSASDKVYGIFPYFVSAFTILFCIAGNTLKNLIIN